MVQNVTLYIYNNFMFLLLYFLYAIRINYNEELIGYKLKKKNE